MNEKIVLELGIVVLACLVVACSGSMAPPRSGPATQAIFVNTPPAHVNSPLIGTYSTTITERGVAGHPELDTGAQKENAGGMALPGTWVLIFRSDGIWIAEDNNDYGRQYIGTLLTREIFLDSEQSTGMFSSARMTDVVCHHKNGKKAVFPALTKYR